MVIDERNTRRERLLSVANEMMTAARTAPKARGIDLIEIKLVTDNSTKILIDMMKKLSVKPEFNFFLRDAENVMHAEAIVLIGTRNQTMSLNCGYCGFDTCAEKNEFPKVPCALNTTDLGIALGSAAALASDRRVDNRIMFSVGYAALQAGFMRGCNDVYGIPISCSSKNPFFDRKSK